MVNNNHATRVLTIKVFPQTLEDVVEEINGLSTQQINKLYLEFTYLCHEGLQAGGEMLVFHVL